MPCLAFVELEESDGVCGCISVAELGRGVMEGLGLGLDLSSFLLRDSKTPPPPVTVSAECSEDLRNGGSSDTDAADVRLESTARSLSLLLSSDCFLALFFFLLIVSVDPSPETKAVLSSPDSEE